MTALPDGPLVAWIGDDFTGAAAVMEVLTFSGFPSVLFLGVPDAALLARFPGMRGIGIATDARTRTPAWMDRHLPAAFAALRATGAPVVHYKLCSTFDSAPHVGSVGRAADLGVDDWSPLLVAAPRIGRWQAFGTLFARAPGGIARLDRHPTMAHHPVTPMDEADIRRHLARQTALPLGLIDLTDMTAGRADAALARERAAGARVVALDVIDDAKLACAGALIWRQAARRQLFVLGSQGVEDALIAAWVADGHALPAPRPAARARGPVAIVSGSCSPDTDRQIAVAEGAGFAGLRLDPVQDNAADVEVQALDRLSRGQSVVVFTARGPNDPAIAAARAAGAGDPGRMLGALLCRLRDSAGVARMGVAGGDTSGAVTAALGCVALTAHAELVPAVPLLLAHAAGGDTTELVLKGGQMGPPDIFLQIRDGACEGGMVPTPRLERGTSRSTI